jgi:hypothetical protein
MIHSVRRPVLEDEGLALRAARALGLAVPAALLLRADHVVE